ncbi:unnamed protein product [Polarella glacialis]|uniref:Uncharacterized protein n=1 Tax=Polarella glacialis TaxID=89957 RepID=A0A813DAU0_POLGL|nr:unnamed protein product [Polarella glacialis]
MILGHELRVFALALAVGTSRGFPGDNAVAETDQLLTQTEQGLRNTAWLSEPSRQVGPCRVPPQWCLEGTYIKNDGICTPVCNSSSYSTVSTLVCSGGALDPPSYECRRLKQWWGGLISLVGGSLVLCACLLGLLGMICSGIATVHKQDRGEASPASYGPGLNEEELEPLSRDIGHVDDFEEADSGAQE